MDTLLLDGSKYLPGARRRGYRSWFGAMAKSMGFDPKDAVHPQGGVVARVDHGRWLADCPNCAGAEIVTEDDPVLLCLSCGNDYPPVNGRFVRVDFPAPAERREAEEYLVQRPLENRNWERHKNESVSHLRDENIIFGLLKKAMGEGE